MQSKTWLMKYTLAAALLAQAGLAGSQQPPRISDGVVKIGVLTDLSGPFVDNVGAGSVLATQLAIEDFGGKVLGMPIAMVSADHLNKADIGASRVREWFDRDNVDVVTELGNSGVALASIKIAQEKGRMAMVTGAGATRISNEDCSPNSVHWVYDTYSLAKVGTQTIAQAGAKTWYFITADYAFGKSLESDGSLFVEAAGAKVLGSSRYPFPGADFSSFVLKAQQSGAQAVALATAGNDLQNVIKQAAEFGLGQKDQKLVAMLISIMDVHGLGLRAAKGMMFAENFYWDRDEASRKFGRRFFEKFKRMPTALQAGQYSAVLHYLKAVKAAGTDDVKEVMKALRAMPIEDAFARNGKLRADGKMVHDMLLVQVKPNEESKYPWDYYKVVKTVPGDQAFMPLSESKCPLLK